MNKGPQPKAINLYSSHGKGTVFQTQLQTTTIYFENQPASRFMAAVATRIPIQNTCRYVNMLFKSKAIEVVRKDRCQISGEHVEFLSCNPDLFLKSTQLSLFENENSKTTNSKPYKLLERIIEEGAWYQLDQNAFQMLRIIPFQWDGNRDAGWNLVFEGTLKSCDKVVANLIKSGKI